MCFFLPAGSIAQFITRELHVCTLHTAVLHVGRVVQRQTIGNPINYCAANNADQTETKAGQFVCIRPNAIGSAATATRWSFNGCVGCTQWCALLATSEDGVGSSCGTEVEVVVVFIQSCGHKTI